MQQLDYSNEIWKDIEGLEGYYQISNFGRVKGLPKTISNRKYNERLLSLHLNKDGYVKTHLKHNGKEYTFLIHRLVAKAFIPNDDPINKFQVNHKDECKTNNYVDNLEWCTNEYNFNYNNRNCIKRAIETRESKRINGVLKYKKSRKVLQIDPNTNEIINSYETLQDMANKTGFSAGTIYVACKNNLIRYKYKWQFLTEGERA